MREFRPGISHEFSFLIVHGDPAPTPSPPASTTNPSPLASIPTPTTANSASTQTPPILGRNLAKGIPDCNDYWVVKGLAAKVSSQYLYILLATQSMEQFGVPVKTLVKIDTKLYWSKAALSK
ncbi:hypothetical protein PI125_g87 [Phytophthora idaei]|nr:hypothetical protein PI125_g87 [Phytophthora idaei]